MIGRTLISAPLALALAAGPALAEDIVRYPIPGSDFPISEAVEVPAGHATVYLSGFGPSVINPNAEKNSLASFGDTRAQTASTLASIEAALKRRNLSLRDVVKMTVFIVGDPAKGGHLDFAGLMEAYREQFGTAAQPNLPTRSAVQVAALANPGWLVEIEVTAVRP
ncbi:RidA family protein [Methylobacterium pseudosasicola]|uniref:Enamine deaminase RidA, house cleaning of reactive enamine intermediates, YjgF/YER057c/UK114 family n=1 Tax=Methylobacterium pseudosasicola TaxID=582667 RepID=A0A1I4V0H8_9HYPH|nr:RidA family protein [Methylobacterium pseudosasicola]SFM94702.1 Enamine deaminase RidA, house cleaning of reactive enamine intermediates, YjgF/YER057c/UK114 family [Methylobacterium pseudosasicola]